MNFVQTQTRLDICAVFGQDTLDAGRVVRSVGHMNAKNHMRLGRAFGLFASLRSLLGDQFHRHVTTAQRSVARL